MTDTSNVVQFGRQPTKAPKGTFREIHFPELARLEEGTNEGMINRILHAAGGSARSLPRTIYFQKAQTFGHENAVAIAALHEVTFDPDNNTMSGKGWMADVPEAHDAVPFILSKALFHNSIDMAEVKGHIEFVEDDDDFHLDLHFDEWKLAATTFVGKPAFANAHGVFPDEITAAMTSNDPIMVTGVETKIRIVVEPTGDEEVIASATGLPSWDYFHVPESEPQKILVGEPNADGWIPVFGHPCLWNSCHDGVDTHCLIPPRPTDGYASFNKPGVLTDRGMVETGPIAMYGGHVPLSKAFDNPANAWCDVRIIPGKHGPWLSGVVRPGTSDEVVYAARASRISGHWKGGRLKAIVSCTAEGYDVPGTSFAIDEQGHVDELVASFPECFKPVEKLPPPDLRALHGQTFNFPNMSMTTTNGNDLWKLLSDIGTVNITLPGPIEDVDFVVAKGRLMLEIALDDEDV